MAKSTTDYKQFKDLSYNREVDKAHVKRLVKSIREKNLLHLNPIIVSKDMEVIDGQHRLEAAKELKLPIHYIMSEDAFDGTEIQQLNSVSKNWSNADYLAYWTVRKAPGFNVLSKFVNQNPAIPFTSAMQLLSSSFDRDTAAFKNGHVDVSNLNYAEEIAEQLKDYRNRGYEIVYNSKFITALHKANEAEGYEHSKMMRKLDMQPRSLVKCVNVKQTIMMLEEIYNYKEQTKTRFI